VLTVSFVGTLGHHIEHSVNIMYGSASLCQSIAGCGPGGEGGVYTLNGQTIYGTLVGAIDNQTISPNYKNSNGGPVVAFAEANYLQNSGNSNYNSLQVALERRSHDITFLVGYTYAKSMDTVAAIYDPRTYNGNNYGYSTFDMRNNLVASYNWELPFYRFMGPHRYSTGWHVTGITRFNSGTPVSLASGGDFALTNISLDYPSEIAPIKKLDPHKPGHNYFDTNSFASGLSCGYEVCGVTGSARQYLFHGPGTINTDAGVEKDTKITERTQLIFRIEMFNVFNHPNFLTNATVGNANSGQFGQVTNTAAGRIGQISGKFIF
jgi:hypothetical protein